MGKFLAMVMHLYIAPTFADSLREWESRSSGIKHFQQIHLTDYQKRFIICA